MSCRRDFQALVHNLIKAYLYPSRLSIQFTISIFYMISRLILCYTYCSELMLCLIQANNILMLHEQSLFCEFIKFKHVR